MTLKRVLGFLILVFIAWYIFTQPQAAGATMHNLLNLLTQAGNSITTFLKST